MTSKKFITVLAIMLIIAVLGVAGLLLAGTVGGAEFGGGKTIVVMFDYVEQSQFETLDKDIDEAFASAGMKVLSKRLFVNILDDKEGAVYTFGSLTDNQTAVVDEIETMQNVKSVALSDNNASAGGKTLLWGGIGTAIFAVIFGIIVAFSSGKLGRAQMTVSAVLTLVITLITSLAANMIIAYFGIKFTVASVAANVAVALLSMVLSAILMNRLAGSKATDMQEVYSEVKKPVFFAAIVLLVALIAFSASMSYYVLSATIPMFVGVLFGALANLYVLLPLWSRMTEKK